jgi:phosphatidylglycerophosphatase A
VNAFLLWIAQGFGVGRMPFAPGTFGSLVGMLWWALLVLTGNLWLFLAGTFLGLAVSVPICAAGEKILQQKDPGSVVWDEIAAIPLCFVGWIAVVVFKTGSFPTVGYFFSERRWLLTLCVFVLFRLFDVVKPSPVRQSQSLPGGWGVTVDDALAALYVNLVILVAYSARLFFTR